MAKRTETWLLYVDESGRFDGDDTASVVTAVLLRGEENNEVAGDLRRVLSGIFPLSPWPPHARVLNQPASRVLFALQGAGTAGPPRDAALARVAAAVRIAQQSTDERLIAICSAAAEPTHALLVNAGEALRHASATAWDALRFAVETERVALRDWFAQVENDLPCGDAVVLAAVARPVEADPKASTGDLKRDRYVDALDTLLERAIALLREEERSAGTEVKISVRVATRGVSVCGLGRMDLNSLHVGAAGRRAGALPSLPGRITPRVITTELVTRYDAFVHPGVVLADLCSNAMKHVLDTRAADRTSWAELENLLRDQLRLPVSRSAPTLANALLPGIAVCQVPRKAIVAALLGEPPVSLAAEPARWAREQALAWVSAIDNARSTQ